MILFSFNIRGLGDDPKFLALKCVFAVIKPDIVFIQETMADSAKACHCFLKIFPGWEVCVVDYQGHSGGLLCIWNPYVVYFVSYSSFAGIILEGNIKGFDERVVFLNCYSPYKDQEPFWKRVVDCGLLQEIYMIIGGDLNFTVSPSEIWGSKRNDPLASFLSDVFHNFGLEDDWPIPLEPT